MSEASLWVRTSGPLAVHVDGLAKELTRQGYAERTTQDHRRLMAHLSGWMARSEWNLLLIGPPGTGKSHTLVGCGVRAVEMRHEGPLPGGCRSDRNVISRAGRSSSAPLAVSSKMR